MALQRNDAVLNKAFGLRLFMFIAVGWLCSSNLTAQHVVVGAWEERPDLQMPVALTNNAVTSAKVAGQYYTYSFGGIDSSLVWSGIRQDAFRLNLNAGWTILPPIPDTLGKIASAASTVKGKIYLIGGYHVLEDGSEISSNRVHIFDPLTNTWLPDGAPVPVPIDDQVQGVYRDSLIYVVTGWSNTSNVANVQIYNPATDSWQVGTPVPATSQYRAFGAAGGIVGNKIIYAGGARMGVNFPIAPYIRCGEIDPADPKQITWSFVEDSLAARYRAAPIVDYDAFNDIWLTGGSSVTYNFDGIAYNGSGGVEPIDRKDIEGICEGFSDAIDVVGQLPEGRMDYRGAGIHRKPDAWGSDDDIWLDLVFLVGGMGPGRHVDGKVFLAYSIYEGLDAPEEIGLYLYPTLSSGPIQVRLDDPSLYGDWTYHLFDLSGRAITRGTCTPPALLDFSDRPVGLYTLVMERQGRKVGLKVALAR